MYYVVDIGYRDKSSKVLPLNWYADQLIKSWAEKHKGRHLGGGSGFGVRDQQIAFDTHPAQSELDSLREELEKHVRIEYISVSKEDDDEWVDE